MLTAFVSPTIRLYVSGKVSSGDAKLGQKIPGLYIFVKADDRFLTGGYVDSLNRYAIDFILEGQSTFSFYIAGNGIDTTLLKSFRKFKSDDLSWDIKLVRAGKKVRLVE